MGDALADAIYENYKGQHTGMGQGLAGELGNQQYRQRQQDFFNGSHGGYDPVSGTIGDPLPEPRRPMFAFVDRFFDQTLGRGGKVVLGLMAAGGGAIATFGYAKERGMPDDQAGFLAAGAAVIGLAVVPLLIITIKLALLAAILGAIGFAGYVALEAANAPRSADAPTPLVTSER
jgi:hypothetical protein